MLTDAELKEIREFFITEEIVHSDEAFFDRAVQDIPKLLDEIDRLKAIIMDTEKPPLDDWILKVKEQVESRVHESLYNDNATIRNLIEEIENLADPKLEEKIAIIGKRIDSIPELQEAWGEIKRLKGIVNGVLPDIVKIRDIHEAFEDNSSYNWLDYFVRELEKVNEPRTMTGNDSDSQSTVGADGEESEGVQ